MTTSLALLKRRLSGAQRYSVAVVLFVVFVMAALAAPSFLTVGNIKNILLQASATSIAAIGMTFVLALGEVDISIGSLMSLAMTVGWVICATSQDTSMESAVSVWIYPIGLVVGVALGVGNAFLINTFRVNSFIATLATMFAYRGIAWKIVGSSDKPFSVSPVLYLGRSEILGIGLPVYLTIAMAGLAILVLVRTAPGRFICAIGGSLRSAVETGLPIASIRLFVYAISGMCCAIAGLITIGQVGVLQAGLGTGFEFTVISAVVLGGTSLSGGRGSIVGSILGATLLVVINNALNLVNASVYIYDVIKGVILISAVIVDVTIFDRRIIVR
jgi:ribose transport system permease protein